MRHLTIEKKWRLEDLLLFWIVVGFAAWCFWWWVYFWGWSYFWEWLRCR